MNLIMKILCFVLLTVNIATIAILSWGKCGLSKCITRYLVSMAVTDLLVVFVDVIFDQIGDSYFPDSFLNITAICSLRGVLRYAASDSSVWLTVSFTFDRFITICCQKLKRKYCTEKTAAIVISTICVLSCVKNIPWYFQYEPYEIIDNIPWYCFRNSLEYYVSSMWSTFELLQYSITPFIPFLLILTLNALTVRHILAANRIRRALRNPKSSEEEDDPETEHRRKSIILLFSISSSFILLWVTHVIHSLLQRISTMSYYRIHVDSTTAEQIGDALRLLSCCTNTCIYAVTQTKFREELKNALKYPFNLISCLLMKHGTS
ncbi:probable G-protein coupled receptor 139 [Rhincodon typus]|uniref:probable G-protein coupled receptor 139 n=1 Tax=Rhincodon typus TaxID=259920 RepID=UPI00202E9ECC|nr:probable G-protein coupled receptor 139 [Rhincodon typus]